MEHGKMLSIYMLKPESNFFRANFWYRKNWKKSTVFLLQINRELMMWELGHSILVTDPTPKYSIIFLFDYSSSKLSKLRGTKSPYMVKATIIASPS